MTRDLDHARNAWALVEQRFGVKDEPDNGHFALWLTAGIVLLAWAWGYSNWRFRK